MQIAALAGCSLLLAALPWSSTPTWSSALLAQEQSGFHTKPPPHNPQERLEQRIEQLLGTWQLVSARIGGSTVPALDVAGYLLVVEDYLSMELHLVMPTQHAIDSEQPFFQSAIRRWRFVGDLRLETSALIGNTNINEAERWDFEVPGSKTIFEIVLSPAQLVLERPGDSRLVFKKLPKLPFPGDPAERASKGTEPPKEGTGGG
jgi:hypothetical protein